MAPLVTVIMSVHNCEKYIGKAIDSILCQTLNDFEFIIINDGSDDGTEKIIKLYRDPRIICVNNGENIGQTRSLNKGIGLARGEYIARMDADDFSSSDRLLIQAEFMERNPKIAVTGSWMRLINEQGRSAGILTYPLAPNFIRLLLVNLINFPCIPHPAAMIRKEIFSKIGLYNERYAIQDYDLWLRIAREYPIRNIPKVLLYYRGVKISNLAVKLNRAKEEIPDMLLSCIKFYLPDLDMQDQNLLLSLLMFNKQSGHNKGARTFEILDNFFEAIRKRDGEKLKIPLKEYNYLSNLAKFFYLPQLIFDDKKYAVETFYKLYGKYRRWAGSYMFTKTALRALFKRSRSIYA